jgi:hypothetical protein
MNPSKKMVLTLLGASFLLCVMAAAASAREVITVNKANGGNYNVTAYNTATKSYYFINGSMNSDSHQITVPNGYACTITVTLGRAVGDRNLYEKQDPLHPIYEVRKKSTYLLELVRTGSGFSSPSPNSVLPNFLGGGDSGQRHPPPGQ